MGPVAGSELPLSPPSVPAGASATPADSDSDAGVAVATAATPAQSSLALLPPPPPPPHNVTGAVQMAASERPQPRLAEKSSTMVSTLPLPAPTVSLPFQPRTQSPSRLLVRPHSSGGAPLMMQRAHSSPGEDSSSRFAAAAASSYTGMLRRPASPLQAGRRRSQFGSHTDEAFMGTPSRVALTMEPNIPEHEELELPEAVMQHANPTTSSLAAAVAAAAAAAAAAATTTTTTLAPKPRRRVGTMLHQSASAPSLHARAVSPGGGKVGSSSASHSRSTSPSLGSIGSRYTNEAYPGSLVGSASSVPSTPTSMRSRSPSISSLETIEDSPDAEEQARLEQEQEGARARGGEDEGIEVRRKSTGEARGGSLRSSKERKRWSVCGAERRADFSLEVIEEQE